MPSPGAEPDRGAAGEPVRRYGVARPARTAARLAWTIRSDIDEIEPIVRALADACRAAGFTERVCRLNVPVAVTEAIANAITCGNDGDPSRFVHITAQVGRESLVGEVTDEGNGFDVEAARRQCEGSDWLEREDGRGVFLMHALMDRVETRCDIGHTVRLLLHRS